jgi:hypothetical protein
MSIYQEVMTVTKPYMGPASEQFISKQCKLYLKIEPEVLSKQHLKDLASWVEVGARRFLEEAKCKEMAAKIARV